MDEHESHSESAQPHHHDDETTGQIERLLEIVARLQTEIDDLQGKLRCRDAEVNQLRANVVGSPALDASDGGLLADDGVLAAVQLDLQRATAER